MSSCKHADVVPLIPEGLSHEETVHQIIYSMQCLEDLTERIFSELNSRIMKSKQKLDNFRERASALQAKIQNISCSKKALKVLSSSKYPADERELYQSIYTGGLLNFHQFGDLTRSTIYPHVKRRLPIVDANSIQGKLNPFEGNYQSGPLLQDMFSPKSGLGDIPEHLQSVGSLLLFNTSDNLYQHYMMVDPLDPHGEYGSRTRHRRNDEESTELAAPPISMSEQQSAQQAEPSIFYNPSLELVPQLEMPEDLPDLLGVADDLSFSDVSSFFGLFGTKSPQSTTKTQPKTTPITSTPTVFVQPTPVQPQQQSAVRIDSIEVQPKVVVPTREQSETVSTHVVQADVLSPSLDISGVTLSDTLHSKDHSLDDLHNSLMAAIRNAGGSDGGRLKSMQSRKIEAKKKKQEEKSGQSVGLDLISDLTAKLAMRRKGISGAKSDPADVQNAMSKVSNMIPPPPQNQPSIRNELDESDDWD